VADVAVTETAVTGTEIRTLLAGEVLLRAAPTGDITEPVHGLFAGDTRHLSHWLCTVDGAVPQPLTTVRRDYTTEAVLVPPFAGASRRTPCCGSRRWTGWAWPRR
jgi:N-terminal domain of (some) glycogen debranching enzymes